MTYYDEFAASYKYGNSSVGGTPDSYSGSYSNDRSHEGGGKWLYGNSVSNYVFGGSSSSSNGGGGYTHYDSGSKTATMVDMVTKTVAAVVVMTEIKLVL